MSVLILGSEGFLGRRLNVFLQSQFVNINLYTDSQKFNSAASLEKTLLDVSPKLIINCIALTNSIKCEDSVEEAYWVNGEIPGIIAEYCKRSNTRLIHISTDAVLDTNSSFKCETAEPCASNIYGLSKLAGEKAVKGTNCDFLICRVNFFGLSHKKNSLLDFFVQNIKEETICSGYTNIFFTPLGVDSLVKYVWQLEQIKYQGIIHLVGNDRISKYEFGAEVENMLKGNNKFVLPYELEINAFQKKMDLSLCNCKMCKVMTPPRNWKVELKEMLTGVEA